jgi:hypothetical protein
VSTSCFTKNSNSGRQLPSKLFATSSELCALRRGELSRMNCEHLARRDGRWVFLDFLGKGNKTRSVAVPLWEQSRNQAS